MNSDNFRVEGKKESKWIYVVFCIFVIWIIIFVNTTPDKDELLSELTRKYSGVERIDFVEWHAFENIIISVLRCSCCDSDGEEMCNWNKFYVEKKFFRDYKIKKCK